MDIPAGFQSSVGSGGGQCSAWYYSLQSLLHVDDVDTAAANCLQMLLNSCSHLPAITASQKLAVVLVLLNLNFSCWC